MTRRVITRRFGWFTALVLLAGCAGSSEVAPSADDVPSDSGSAATTEATIEATSTAAPDDAGQTVEAAGHDGDAPEAREDDAASAPVRSITIGGMGSDYGPPDRSIVDVGVSAQRPSVDEATRQAADAGESMLAALATAGVPADGIQTSEFSIHPHHTPPDYSVVAGYDATIGYRVTIEDVTDLGAILAQAVAAGGDSVRAWSVRFEGDPDDHMATARAEAWDDVRARASATAGQIGEPLGEVLDVHEKVLVTSPHGMTQGGEGDSASFDIPVSPGVVGVVVLLTVTYAIGT